MLQSKGPAPFKAGSFYTPQIFLHLSVLRDRHLTDTHREDGHEHIDGPCSNRHVLDVIAFHTCAEVDLVSIVVDLEEKPWGLAEGPECRTANGPLYPNPSKIHGRIIVSTRSVACRFLPPQAHGLPGMPLPRSRPTAAGQP